MWLIVGLGNPGTKYARTRHNVGFEVVDFLSQRYSFPQYKSFLKSEVSRGQIDGHDAILCKPQTFMNLSGDAVGPVMKYYGITHLLVVHDELDFEEGIIRIKENGGHGGHNGLRSIIQHIGADFLRIRIGIGKPHPGQDTAGFVLSRFDATTQARMTSILDQAADAVVDVITLGAEGAMRRHHGRRVDM